MKGIQCLNSSTRPDYRRYFLKEHTIPRKDKIHKYKQHKILLTQVTITLQKESINFVSSYKNSSSNGTLMKLSRNKRFTIPITAHLACRWAGNRCWGRCSHWLLHWRGWCPGKVVAWQTQAGSSRDHPHHLESCRGGVEGGCQVMCMGSLP